MKKTLLAVVLPTLFVTGANAAEIFKSEEGSAEFYGQIRTELTSVNDSETDTRTTNLNTSGSRGGINAKYNVSDDLYVHGLVEFGLPGNGEVAGRLHYAGFGGDWGKVSLGRQYTTQDDFYGADFSYWFGGSGIRYLASASFKHDNYIKYAFDGENFSIGAGYGLDENNSAPSTAQLFGSANFGDFDFILGGATDKDEESGVGKLESTAYTGSVGYTFEKSYVQATYYNAEYKNQVLKIKEDAFSVAANYDIQDNATIYAGFEYVKHDALDELLAIGVTNASDNSKNLYAGIVYHLNSWSRIWIEGQYADGTTLGGYSKGADKEFEAQIVDGDFNGAVGFRVYW
ncbi:porin [Vibrio sp. SCSIO 43140]|uniref:porin n=1 Tax=Vibrio sp. SCSIO 43140 TaxID=2819100 RepID=UPI0020757CA7|nr:porin [Vibrio sp. SCSIO 43140]USD59450.1 porin [Vibrio sp. SCSIO 43140]